MHNNLLVRLLVLAGKLSRLFLTLTLVSASAYFATEALALTNPASEYCIQMGGQLQIQTNDSGGQYGVCLFDDNRQCEEWALFRHACPKGGIKITGYTKSSEIFCAITGHKVNLEHNQCQSSAHPTQFCPLDAFYNGRCTLNA